MKTRFPSILGVFAAILMVASFVVPMNIAAPAAVTADPGIMKWDTVHTPGSGVGYNDILNTHGLGANTGMGSEVLDMVAGNDGMSMAFIVRTYAGALSALMPGTSNYRNWLRIHGTLNYSTNYFWRVKALEVNGQNIPSDWSATFSM